MEPTPQDSVLARMRADHRALLEAVDALEREVAARLTAHSPFPVRAVRTIADRLAADYASHVIEEDGLILPLLAGQLPDVPVTTERLRQEHAEIAAMLGAFRETLDRPAHRERDEQLRVQAQDLAALLRSQVRKEETLVFTIAARQAARARTKASPKRHSPRGGAS